MDTSLAPVSIMSHPRLPVLRTLAQGIGALLAGSTALAFDDLEPESGFFVRAGGFYRTGLKFSVRDTLPQAPTAPGQYDNGFVREGISGTGAGLTWNWGYQNATQIDVARDQLVFQRLNDRPRVGTVSSSEEMFGGEVVAGFEVTRFEWWKREVRLGLEGGYGFATFSSRVEGQASSNALLTTARHDLGGVIPPVAPYSGSFNGPGPLLGLQPAGLTTQTATGVDRLAAQVDATLHSLRFGPYFDWPVGDKLQLGLAFGYATLLPDAEVVFQESVMYENIQGPDPGAAPGSGGWVNEDRETRVRRSKWRPGVFFQVRAQYNFTERIGAFVAADYFYHADLHIRTPGREATLGLGSILGGTVGMRLSF